MKFALLRSAIASLLFVACAPAYTVIRQATPNPFPGVQCKLGVEPLDFRGMNVGNEPESKFLAKKAADETRSYEADKVTMSQNFVNELVSLNQPWITAGKQAFTVRVKLTNWEPGFYAYAAARNSEASAVIEIVDDKGTVVDEVTTTGRVGASITNPSTGGRMHSMGKVIARQLTSYLQGRLGCK